MGERDDDKLVLGPLAMQMMASSRVVDLKADCIELSQLFAGLDDISREKLLILLFGDGV
jgi:hypothetical protein